MKTLVKKQPKTAHNLHAMAVNGPIIQVSKEEYLFWESQRPIHTGHCWYFSKSLHKEEYFIAVRSLDAEPPFSNSFGYKQLS